VQFAILIFCAAVLEHELEKQEAPASCSVETPYEILLTVNAMLREM